MIKIITTSVYRTFRPFIMLINCHDKEPVQQWALWAVQYVTTKNSEWFFFSRKPFWIAVCAYEINSMVMNTVHVSLNFAFNLVCVFSRALSATDGTRQRLVQDFRRSFDKCAIIRRHQTAGCGHLENIRHCHIALQVVGGWNTESLVEHVCILFTANTAYCLMYCTYRGQLLLQQ